MADKYPTRALDVVRRVEMMCDFIENPAIITAIEHACSSICPTFGNTHTPYKLAQLESLLRKMGAKEADVVDAPLRTEVEQLGTENAKLRQRLDVLEVRNSELARACDRAEPLAARADAGAGARPRS